MPSFPLPTVVVYCLAALCEIAGCFAFWAWLRLDRSVLFVAPGLAALAAFAWLLTWVDQPAAGRSFAAYGGVYIVASLAWMWLVEGVRPDRFDLAGMALALSGAVIIFAPTR